MTTTSIYRAACDRWDCRWSSPFYRGKVAAEEARQAHGQRHLHGEKDAEAIAAWIVKWTTVGSRQLHE